MGCPDPECLKAAHIAFNEDVSAVLSKEIFQQWWWLKEKQAFE